MQKISRRIYNELFHDGSTMLNEREEFSIEQFQKIKGIQDQYKYLSDLAKKKILRYVDEGTSRMVYVMEDGKCLKVAKVNEDEDTYAKGIAQNKAEVQNSKLGEKYGCFTKVYSYDSKDFTCLVTECCSSIQPDDWRKLFRVSLQEIMAILGICIGYNHRKPMTLKQVRNEFWKINNHASDDSDVQDGLDEYNCVERLYSSKIFHYIGFLDEMLASMEPKYKALQQVLKFWMDNGPGQMSIEDLCLDSNWGLRNVDGHDVPVILDSGMTDEVLYSLYS